MDKLSKLQALLPEVKVSKTAESSPWTHYPKPTHLYEGTDSEDDEEIMRWGKMEQSQMSQSSWVPAGAETGGNSDDHGYQQRPAELSNYQLSLGQLAVGGESFCPWLVIKKYPYAYVGNVNRDKVAKAFWDEGKLLDQTWDFFYIRRLPCDANQTAILFVPTKQFEAFLATINRNLRLQLAIPSGGAGNVFRVTFDDYGTPEPRYLGQSTNKSMANNLHSAVPPSWFKPKNESEKCFTSSDRSIAAFKAKIDLIVQAQKGRKVVNAEKKKTERFAKQQSWNHSTKRVQRYLGLRQASHEFQVEIAGAGLADYRFDCDTYDTTVKASIPRSADFDPDKPAPFDQESDVVFVCVDIEANERNSTQITEIGIATLDARDIKSLAPGERGANWLSKIRARHFRINEYKHITNTEFVSGCPDRFEFGESEFVKLKDAPQAVAKCFKPPFSNTDERAVIDQNEPKRNIILVGHSVGADVTYLKSLGYDVHNLSNLQEIIDTAFMWQALKRELSPRNLGNILAEIDIAGWNLHNAGNDAVYTLQAMIGISVKQLHEREKQKEVKDQEKKTRVEDSVKEATQNALEREEGWSSGGENSDGGGPVAPAPPRIKKSIVQPPNKCSQYREGPWRAPAQNASMDSYKEKIDGYWRPAVVSGNHPAPSNDSWGLAEQKVSPHGSILPSTTPTASDIRLSPSNNSWGQIQQQSWIQGASLPGSIPTPARHISAQSTENMDEVKMKTPAPSQTTWVQGPAHPSTVPTPAWSLSTDTRNNVDEAEQKTPAFQQTPQGSYNSRQKNANGVRNNGPLHQRD